MPVAGSTDAPGSASGKTDPSCALVTPDAVAKAAGFLIAKYSGGGGTCVYQNSDKSKYLAVQLFNTQADMATVIQLEPSGEHISNLGDDAFWVAGAGFLFVKKGDPYPTSDPQMRVFRTQGPNARVIAIPIYGGDDLERASANERQGDAFAILPPGLPAGAPIRVVLWLDRDGVFKLSAHLQNGQDLRPWVMEKGETQQRAIQELEEVERVLGQKAQTATPRDLQAVEDARERVFDRLSAGEFDATLVEVRELMKRTDETTRADAKEALREKAENLIGFTRFVLETYRWTFDESGRQRLHDLANATEEALGGDLSVLEMRVAALDTDTDHLPEAVSLLLGIRGAIRMRIQPFEPAAAARLEQELGRLESRLASGDMGAPPALNSLAGQVAATMEEIPELSAGVPCSRGHLSPARERYCPFPGCGEDTWQLRA